MNTPTNIVEAIRPMIEGKWLCDLGCGDGSFLEAAKDYAKEVVGLQWSADKMDLEAARQRLFLLIEGDLRTIEWPRADVYYWFVYAQHLEQVLQKHQRGTLIIGGTPAKFENYPASLRNGILIDIETKDHEEPIWRLAIIQK